MKRERKNLSREAYHVKRESPVEAGKAGIFYRFGACAGMTKELATPVSEQIPGFHAAVFRRIIGIIKLADLYDFFLDQPPKTL